jgi:hypothetical protein
MLRFPDRPDALPLDLIRGFETTSRDYRFLDNDGRKAKIRAAPAGITGAG